MRRSILCTAVMLAMACGLTGCTSATTSSWWPPFAFKSKTSTPSTTALTNAPAAPASAWRRPRRRRFHWAAVKRSELRPMAHDADVEHDDHRHNVSGTVFERGLSRWLVFGLWLRSKHHRGLCGQCLSDHAGRGRRVLRRAIAGHALCRFDRRRLRRNSSRGRCVSGHCGGGYGVRRHPVCRQPVPRDGVSDHECRLCQLGKCCRGHVDCGHCACRGRFGGAEHGQRDADLYRQPASQPPASSAAYNDPTSYTR